MRLIFALVLAVFAIAGLVAGSLEDGQRRKGLLFRGSATLLVAAIVVAAF